jgi:hypothetical protein
MTRPCNTTRHMSPDLKKSGIRKAVLGPSLVIDPGSLPILVLAATPLSTTPHIRGITRMAYVFTSATPWTGWLYGCVTTEQEVLLAHLQ